VRPTPTPTVTPSGGGGWIALAAKRDDGTEGDWDLYAVPAGGGEPIQLTRHPAPDMAPAWSPDGRRLAFQSRRGGGWDIFWLDVTDGTVHQVTDDLPYDGRPAWSPDGRRIAFDSYRAGDLDIFVVDVESGEVVNLTADSPAADYAPAWSPDGRCIAYTSTVDPASAADAGTNKEIFAVATEPGETCLGSATGAINLTQHPAQDEDPAWSPDGRRLAFTSDRDGRRRVYVMDLNAPGPPEAPLAGVTALDHHRTPTWSPDGRLVALANWGGWQSTESQTLAVLDVDQGWMRQILDRGWLIRDPAWGQPPSVPHPAEGEPESGRLYVEDVSPGEPGQSPSVRLVRLEDVEAPIRRLSDRVDDSFLALRQRILAETGHDYLGQLSEALRPVDFHSEDSEYLSWHKAGRAIDLLWDLRDDRGQPLVEVAQERVGGETFWRLYVRCARQDGSQGEPLTDVVWDTSYEARWGDQPSNGGRPKGVLYGYYADFTDLAWSYGWRRISSHELPNFNWKTNFLALEYWHFQKTEGLVWYQAMREVLDQEELERYFSWEALEELGEDPWLAVAKGIRPPAGEAGARGGEQR